MWINKTLFEHVIADNRRQQEKIQELAATYAGLSTVAGEAKAQKARDDISIDWMRHRINALEKERAVLMNKVGGVVIPVPEIVPSRPGTITPLPLDMNHLPSFEDVGDAEAIRLGATHDNEGHLSYKS